MEVTIEKLIFGGLGLARTENGVIFVTDCVPGETVQCNVEGKQQGVPVATVVEIVKQSAFRRQPACKYFGECGGCDWLYIDYEFQVQNKKEIFLDCLKRIGKVISVPEIDIFTSPETNYRIRAQFKGSSSVGYGFFKRKTNDIVRLDYCPLLNDKCNNILSYINKKGFRSTGAKDLKLIAGANGSASQPVISGITKDTSSIEFGAFNFKVYGDSFFQSNNYLLESMGTWASKWVGGEFCVDLYGGTGFFSVMLGKSFSSGILIENVNAQVELARYNLAVNGCKNITAQHSDSEKMLSFIKKKPDLLIVDPPRPGLTKEVRNSILKVGPKKILYVSCNPSTQARDINSFIGNSGYSITHAALFDCYPNTHHLETALLLERK